MIEANAFLAAFAVQILVGSVLNPHWFIKYVRGWADNFGSERYLQMTPGFDYRQWAERFAAGYRLANFGIALLGVLLMAWLFDLVRHPDWIDEVSKLTVAYFMLQMSPLILMSLYAIVRYRKELIQLMQPSQEAKRKATLQRRGLLDFVSPFAVCLAVASYILFVVFAIYLDLNVYGNTSLSRQCYLAIGSVTLVYAMNAFIVYRYLYGRKNPLVTQEGRVHTIGVRVKGSVYSSIAVAWFVALMGALGLQGFREWNPFALCVFFVIITLLGFMDVTAPPRKPGANELGTTGVTS